MSYLSVQFYVDNRIRALLGFENLSFNKQNSCESSSIVNILSINSILVHCSLLEMSYFNEDQKLYSFLTKETPGYKKVKNPLLPPANDHKNINIRRYDITVILHLKRILNKYKYLILYVRKMGAIQWKENYINDEIVEEIEELITLR